MSVAAHQVLQMGGLVTGLQRVGGIGPQMCITPTRAAWKSAVPNARLAASIAA